MAKKIPGFFFNDLLWKLLSLCLAIVLWFVGMNILNPSVRQSLGRNLQIYNYDWLIRDDILLLNFDELIETEITMGVRAALNDFDGLGIADLIANADMRVLDPSQIRAEILSLGQPLRVPFNVNAYFRLEGFELQSISPNIVYATLDLIVQESFDVELTRTGQVAEGHILLGTNVANPTVNITGALSIIQRIAMVEVALDIAQRHSSFYITERLIVLDYYGEDITDLLDLGVSETTIEVQILPYKTIPTTINVTGEPAEDFIIYSRTHSPESVVVMGTPAALYPLESISVDIELGGTSESIYWIFNLKDWLPEGVYLRNGDQNELAAQIIVEPICNRTFEVPMDEIRIVGIGAFDIVDEATHVQVVARGPLSLMQELDAALIGLEIDLRGLAIGLHRVDPRALLPPGTTLSETVPPIEVQILEIIIPGDEPDEPDYDGSDYGDTDEDYPYDYYSYPWIDYDTGAVYLPAAVIINPNGASSYDDYPENSPYDENENQDDLSDSEVFYDYEYNGLS